MQEVVNQEIVVQLGKVASAVNAALIAVACGAEEDTEAALRVTKMATEMLDLLVNPPQIGGVYREAVNLYTSPNVPEGYMTVLGYMYAVSPDLFAYVDPTSVWKIDEDWIADQTRKKGIPIIEVEACVALRGRGVATSNAYPREIIRERLY